MKSAASSLGSNERPEILLSGLAVGESPRWHEDHLWFCNWGTQEIVRASIDTKRSEVVTRIQTTVPYSIDWLPDGRLLVVSGQERFLLRREANGLLVTHVDLRKLARGPCNEIVVDGRGNTYVNAMGSTRPDESAKGIIALVSPDGLRSRQVADGIAFPNGMAVTADNSTLIVAESYGGKLTAFDIGADGSLSNRRVWAELTGRAPDGICIDEENCVWYADVPNKRCERVREGGEILQTVQLDRGCFACMLGGNDRKTLFIMAAEWRDFERTFDERRTGQVLTTLVSTPGRGWP